MDDIFNHHHIFMDDKLEQLFGVFRIACQIGQEIFNPACKIGFFKVAAPDGDQNVSIGRFFERFTCLANAS